MLKPAKVMPLHLEGAHIVFSASGQRMNQNRGLRKDNHLPLHFQPQRTRDIPAATLIICPILTKFLGLYGIYREGALYWRGKE